MFSDCTSIKLSETQTGIYQKPYRIPIENTGNDFNPTAMTNMFAGTGGTFTGTPTINTTYYLACSKEEMENLYVTFSSPTSFTLSVNNPPATHVWEGSMYYSTDLITWNEWNGTTTITAAQNNNKYVIYTNGIGNTLISGINTSSYYPWKLTGTNISIEGNIATLLDWTTVKNNTLPTLGICNICFLTTLVLQMLLN